ncbi:YihY/virulence factor BrkB family protein [Falsiroseomonas sp.]|uniref:YihY/virulence factor BrkB family protein n=1 Tax=Falsiroseomonas sp. TaxID=2870721 RepID=UPI002725E2BA|nr:YihY/virulence factor BrkB family protein [Falsiroseomonas sp.]MDO9503189.1 YihY/virulence factor BrkB family protein [Falsiroseomonas sp.]MDP3416195.1 YihY/virulence factor BrkB family protein [Falsiroseomonas sp.]
MLLARTRALLADTIRGYIADEAMTRGAAIACYTMFSLVPLLVVAVGIASVFFGEAIVQGAVDDQLVALVGRQGASAVQSMVRDAGGLEGTGVPALVGLVVLLITASGVFAELQGALNAIWKTQEPSMSVSYLLRARLLSMGLVGATGFLLLVSLIASALLAALGAWTDMMFPEFAPVMRAMNMGVSFLLTALLFAAIYKVLPDRRLRWRDVAVGALVTAFLFTIGRVLIGWYLGGSGIAARYGAAGALIVVLLWVYYSAQVFLLGAEFTRAWTGRIGSRRKAPVGGVVEPPPSIGDGRDEVAPGEKA